MIDEELYELAADELNSDRRKSDIWARACALASDDHDEARYLYTNLRVEEMLAEREAGNDPIAAALAPKSPNSPTADQSTATVVDHSEAMNPQAYDGLTLEPVDLSHLEETPDENNDSEIRVSSMRPGIDASNNVDRLTDEEFGERTEQEAVRTVEAEMDNALSADEIDKFTNVDGQAQVSSVSGTDNLDMDSASDIDLSTPELLDDTHSSKDDGSVLFDETDLASLGSSLEQTSESQAPKISSLDALFDEVDDRVQAKDIVDADIIEDESLTSLVRSEPQKTPVNDIDSRDAEFTREMERQAEDLPSAENDLVSYTSKLESELPDMLQDESPPTDFDDTRHDLSSVPEEVRSTPEEMRSTEEVLAAAAAFTAGGGAAAAASQDDVREAATSHDDAREAAASRDDARERVKTDYADKNDFRDDLDNQYPDYAEDDDYYDPVDLTDTGRGSRYAIYEKNNKAKAIRMGVSWTALFFTIPWLLYRRLFGTAIVYSVLWLVLVTGLVVTGLSWLDAGANASNAQRLLTIGFGLLSVIGLLYIPFRYGNTWRATKLEKRGYDLAAWVRAKSPRKALNAARRAAALA